MKLLPKVIALVPAARTIGQGLALLCLLALLALVGAGVSRALPASVQAGTQLAGTNGDIHIGSQAATNGTIHVGGIAATNGEIHIGG